MIMPFPQSAFQSTPEGPRILDSDRFRPEKRRQLSGAGLRTFLRIADEWQLSERERLHVLGLPSRSTFHGWVAKVRQGKDITLSVDELMRISAVLGIYKALGILFPRESDADRWLRSENRDLIFGGQSPLALIVSGTQDGLILVRRYLDAWRGGRFATPLAGFDDAAAPLSENDLVFV
jgi:Protein of unknown function (DUF2384)